MPTAQVNGAEIYYEEVGSGPAIVLTAGGLKGVHGYFSGVVGELAKNHRVVTYDRRFGGLSKSPMVVQSWDLCCLDVIGLMDALGIDKATLGGNSFGAAISLNCAYRYPDRVSAILPGTVAGGVACDVMLGAQLLSAADLALNSGMQAVAEGPDPTNRYAHFIPDAIQTDSDFRKAFESIPVDDFVQAMRDTVDSLFDGNYVTLGTTEELLRGVRTPALVMPGNDDIHPRAKAETVHRMVPGCQWGEVRRPTEEPEKYIEKVLKFLGDVGA